MAEEKGSMNFVWSEETFGISHLAEQVELPQLLKYVQDSTNTQRRGHQTVFADGEMLKLHGVKSFKKVAVEVLMNNNENEHHSPRQQPGPFVLSVPAAVSKTLLLLPYRQVDYVFKTAGDLVKETPRPSAVIVNKAITLHEKNCVIQAGDILAITSVDKRCTNTGVVDFLICKHHDKTIGLPMGCIGNFTALPDERHHTIKELLSKSCEFPQRVSFLDNQTPVESQQYTTTLSRAGENQLVAGAEYILQEMYKQPYLVCTKCSESEDIDPDNMHLYFIPANSITTRTMRFKLPMFCDMASYRQAVNNRYCTNLSMKYILDCTPIETIGSPSIVVKKMCDVYDLNGPQLPPRARDQDSVSLRSLTGSCVPEEPSLSNYANIKVFHSRTNSAESPQDGVNLQQGEACSTSKMEEEEPLLLTGSGKSSSKQNSPSLLRRRQENSRGGTPKCTPVLSRKGASTPCTPESSRRKRNSPPSSWTEKISISLENLKRNFRKAGSEEKTKIGDGSQLTDSFEELNLEEPDGATTANYENVQGVISQLSKAHMNKRPVVKGQTRCAQIKELWTPPCSPDYRDHSTPSFDALTVNVMSSSDQSRSTSTHNPEENALQKSATAPTLYNEPSFYQSVANGLANHQASGYMQLSQAISRHSPVAAPRYSKETNHEASNSVYENIDYIAGMTPQSRCSGYSSGSRGSSEGDLVQYQLDSIRTMDTIPDDLSTLNIRSLGDCLHLFELHNVANKFKQHQIDGQFFTMMNDRMFKDEAFNFSDFEILKLKRLRDGWRPKM